MELLLPHNATKIKFFLRSFIIRIVYWLSKGAVFFKVAANDRGYGHGRVAGVFAVAQRQGECGRKTAKLHVSQPVTIGVC